jgi:hypothetical protein
MQVKRKDWKSAEVRVTQDGAILQVALGCLYWWAPRGEGCKPCMTPETTQIMAMCPRMASNLGVSNLD